MHTLKTLTSCTLFSMTLLALTACGGGGGGDSSSSGSNSSSTYTISGIIDGLTGAGLVLQNNGSDDLSINAGATSFTFASAIAGGGTYNVTVLTNPTAQSCVVNNGSGSVGSANITNITINCVPKNELVSRSSDDSVIITAYDSHTPVISSDGRYVAFASSTANLAAGHTNGSRQIFVRDRQTNQTVLVSRVSGSDGAEGNGSSFNPVISSDGRYVAYESYATNLVSGDTNGSTDIFLRDLQLQTTTRVSVGPGGIEANGGSAHASISGDGRYVAFWSWADNLTASGINDQVFVRDLQTGTTTLVSVGLNGANPNYGSDYPALSADGSRIAFWSYASNLVAGDTNGVWDIFLYDVATNQISLVSVASDGTQKNQGTESSSRTVQPSISADGNVVAFSTTADNLVAGDTNGMQDVFVHKMDTGETIRASVGTGGVEANNNSPAGQGERIALSSDGTWVAFSTSASNIAAGGTNVLLHNISTGATTAITASATSSGGWEGPAISGDGRYVNFISTEYLDPRFSSSGIFVQDRTVP